MGFFDIGKKGDDELPEKDTDELEDEFDDAMDLGELDELEDDGGLF